MISLETAKKLKDAGLEWEPKFGDIYQLIVDGLDNIYCYDEGIRSCVDAKHFNPLWLPRLDQLLAEIEKRGWHWAVDVIHLSNKRYRTEIYGPKRNEIYDADYPEEAAAQALLWILQKEADNG